MEGFDRTEDAVTLGSLISAYETGDDEKFQNCISRPHMKGMDNEVREFMQIWNGLEFMQIYFDSLVSETDEKAEASADREN